MRVAEHALLFHAAAMAFYDSHFQVVTQVLGLVTLLHSIPNRAAIESCTIFSCLRVQPGPGERFYFVHCLAMIVYACQRTAIPPGTWGHQNRSATPRTADRSKHYTKDKFSGRGRWEKLKQPGVKVHWLEKKKSLQEARNQLCSTRGSSRRIVVRGTRRVVRPGTVHVCGAEESIGDGDEYLDRHCF